ncbi:MAG: hypothetical protein U9N73_00735 [Candidatus Auribacterota bacterium]|nr:hypothetical protein [Candidatus Auribacterota bacterium]
MEKKKKELILIGILVPVLGLFLWNSLSTVAEKKKKAAAKKESSPPAAQPAAVPEVAVEVVNGTKTTPEELPPLNKKLEKMQKTVADEPWGRDPFLPPPVKEQEKESTNWKEFKLSGIIPGRTATINGEIIGVGEKFEGYRLTGVDNYQITLEKDEQSYILTMPEEQ